MRFGLTVHPGFKSPSLRTTSASSDDHGRRRRRFDLQLPSPVAVRHSVHSACPGRALAFLNLRRGAWVHRSVVATRAWPRISYNADVYARSLVKGDRQMGRVGRVVTDCRHGI
jgi:hypothetical protein